MQRAQTLFPVASLKSGIILLIDSLKNDYNVLPESAKTNEVTRENSRDIKRLLNMIRQLNRLQKDSGAGAVIPDTISYWKGTGIFSEEKWKTIYFEVDVKYPVLTFLSYLENQTIAME